MKAEATTIFADDCTTASDGSLCIEASDIGWPPGYREPIVTINGESLLYKANVYHRGGTDLAAWRYTSVSGRKVLLILND